MNGVVRAVRHLGLCVSDFERSLRFYTEGLGFELAERFDIPSALADPDGIRIELVQVNR
jgi:lactoylglutathione lyase